MCHCRKPRKQPSYRGLRVTLAISQRTLKKLGEVEDNQLLHEAVGGVNASTGMQRVHRQIQAHHKGLPNRRVSGAARDGDRALVGHGPSP